jgi:glucokinase
MYLGIEIGGTKLQLAVGSGEGADFVAFERRDIDPRGGASRILEQIREAGSVLLSGRSVRGIGIGFGGPVRTDGGRVITSHQVPGWDEMPLVDWCRDTFGLPAALGNDCDLAALAEARLGAGQGSRSVFFVTVGTGIGGGLVLDGQLHGAGRPAVAEIGHLRPGLSADLPPATVESLAAGPAIAADARRQIIRGGEDHGPHVDDLLTRCHGDLDRLTAKLVGEAAKSGNLLAQDVLRRACRVLGWALAQMMTLLAAEVAVVGGGVSLIGEDWFFTPLREEVARYVFPPLADSYRVAPAQLGEQVVVHGSLAWARDRFADG